MSNNIYFYDDICSQDYNSTFTYDGITYSSFEQWMLSKKASYMGDFNTHYKIMSTSDPNWIRMLGSQMKKDNIDNWNKNCFNIAALGNYLKFSQNSGLLRWLLQTNDSPLIHAPPHKRVWGEGLLVYDASVTRIYQNDNFLGLSIMEARHALQKRYTF